MDACKKMYDSCEPLDDEHRALIIEWFISTVICCCKYSLTSVKSWAVVLGITRDHILKNRQCLYTNCENLTTFCWLVSTFELTLEDICGHSLVFSAMKHGNIPFVNWIITTYGLTGREICGLRISRMAFSCGHFEFAKTLVENFEFTSEDIHRADVLFDASMYGQDEIAKFVVNKFSPSAEQSLPAMRQAFENGHLELAQWFVKMFEFTADEVCNKYDSTIWNSCSNGNINVTEWLMKEFRPNLCYPMNWIGDDFAFDDRGCLGNACFRGDLKTVQWIVEKFGLTVNTIRAEKALLYACDSENLELVEWLVTTFGLTAVDVCAEENRAFINACVELKLDVAKWLFSKFNLKLTECVIQNILQAYKQRESREGLRSETPSWNDAEKWVKNLGKFTRICHVCKSRVCKKVYIC